MYQIQVQIMIELFSTIQFKTQQIGQTSKNLKDKEKMHAKIILASSTQQEDPIKP